MTEYYKDFPACREFADSLAQAYLEAVDVGNPPAPAQAASELLSVIADGFREHNASVPESGRWDIPVELEARHIAALVMQFHDVCLLPWPDGPDTAREHCRLHVYQPCGMDGGHYTTDILSVIEAFVPDIDLFTEQDVEAVLRGCSEVRERQDSGDSVAWTDLDLFMGWYMDQDIRAAILRDFLVIRAKQDSVSFVAVDKAIPDCRAKGISAFSPEEYVFIKRSSYEPGERLAAWREPA